MREECGIEEAVLGEAIRVRHKIPHQNFLFRVSCSMFTKQQWMALDGSNGGSFTSLMAMMKALQHAGKCALSLGSLGNEGRRDVNLLSCAILLTENS